MRKSEQHEHAKSVSGAEPDRFLFNDAQWAFVAKSLGLSRRELQIIHCVFDGKDEPTIAVDLGISKHTIRTHLRRLYRKLGVHNRCRLLMHVFAAHLRQSAHSAVSITESQSS